MKKGKLAYNPIPTFWVDWRCVFVQHSLAMKLMFRVLQNTTLFDRAAKWLKPDKKVLHWFARNHMHAFDIILVGQETGCLDQLIAKRLANEWVQRIGYFENIQDVKEELKLQPWVLGVLTKDPQWIDPTKDFYEFTGHTMNLKEL
jgi:hypothetical protein